VDTRNLQPVDTDAGVNQDHVLKINVFKRRRAQNFC